MIGRASTRASGGIAGREGNASNLSIFALLCALTLYGCSNSSTPSTSATLLYPLSPGEYWAYSVSTFDSVGALVSSLPDTVRVLDVTSRFGPEWQTTVRPRYLDTEYYSFRSDGVWRRDNYAYYPTLIYKYPTNVGDTFNTTFDSTGTDVTGTYLREAYRTVSVNEHVTVPAGSFSCIHYDWIWDEIDTATSKLLKSDTITETFVSRGIGMVQSILHGNTYDINGLHPMTSVTTLVSH